MLYLEFIVTDTCTAFLSRQMDKKFSKMAFGCIQGAIPVRVGSMNMCYPPSFFRLVWAIISVFLHE